MSHSPLFLAVPNTPPHHWERRECKTKISSASLSATLVKVLYGLLFVESSAFEHFISKNGECNSKDDKKISQLFLMKKLKHKRIICSTSSLPFDLILIMFSCSYLEITVMMV